MLSFLHLFPSVVLCRHLANREPLNPKSKSLTFSLWFAYAGIKLALMTLRQHATPAKTLQTPSLRLASDKWTSADLSGSDVDSSKSIEKMLKQNILEERALAAVAVEVCHLLMELGCTCALSWLFSSVWRGVWARADGLAAN